MQKDWFGVFAEKDIIRARNIAERKYYWKQGQKTPKISSKGGKDREREWEREWERERDREKKEILKLWSDSKVSKEYVNLNLYF